MIRKAAFTLLISTLPLCGCAGLDVTSIGTNTCLDSKARGFRYYQPAPFLFVCSDGKGGLISQIKFLPDVTQKMSAQPYAYGASNESTLQFDAGILTQATVIIDETVVPAATLDALAKALGAAAKAALNAPEASLDGDVPVPYLFRIVVRDNIVELKGGPFAGAALGMDQKAKAIIKATLAKPGK